MRIMLTGMFKKAKTNKNKFVFQIISGKSTIEKDILTQMLTSLPCNIYSHSVRVSVVSGILAKKINNIPKDAKTDNFSFSVSLGGLYHHIGEIAIHSKEKKHLPCVSELIIDENLQIETLISNADKEVIMDTVRHYHERMDGSGYPDGLSGNEISITARIVGFADILDKLLTGKNKTTKKHLEKALKFTKKQGIVLFGMDVIECFDETQDEIFNLYLNHQKRIQASA